MLSIPLRISPASSNSLNTFIVSHSNIIFKKPTSFLTKFLPSSNQCSLLSFSQSGCCRASQVVDYFPTMSPEIIVREAKLEDYWEVAEIHCSSFFPEFSFPLDFLLRIDRLLLAMLAAILTGLARPRYCKRIYLVAVIGSSHDETFLLESEDSKIAGILTVDNFAEFLPRKGPGRRRRTGIAYIANVAVRENFRGKGIAKKLIANAESKARSWGCSAIALHCDLNNPMATKLYQGQGFKCIKVPEGAKWPQPKTSPDIKFNFMMKLLNNSVACN
ncbi:PREDICTED: uncharacterized protein LOC109352328 isoform X2 [Lupinus angustifolius]|uniref:uncharacterized protein LOC109352328 isoform X2 n=1 Tax=Lupinus angustifolius TaxID=3871 RepID=UPI00092EC56A|nr:PREDICTED: uncharacterized protein LOC109352328 isoform X2 [Lupinus angustifolius]